MLELLPSTLYNSFIRGVGKITMGTSTNKWDNLGRKESPACATALMPPPPPLLVVGGITFYFECAVFGLITSQYPIVPTLLLEVEMGWDKEYYGTG